MCENRKKVYISLFLMIVTLIGIGFYVVQNNNKRNSNNDFQEKNANDLAIMVFDYSTADYVMQSTFPKGNYILNYEKSKCVSGNTIGAYDAVNGTVLIDFTTADKCYLYFDKSSSKLSTYLIEEVYNSPKNQNNIKENAAGLYYHDMNLANGTRDNTYRFAGDDADINNYVCFYGDDCTDVNNLYRIISLDSVTNQVKVVKETSLGDKKWDENNTNTWDGSTIETYLNGEYLSSLGDKAEKIVFTEWSVGGIDSNTYKASIPKRVYDLETGSTTKVTKKIGLIYLSDYMYAALPECWTLVGFNIGKNDYSASVGKDWMLNKDDVWTITRNTYYDSGAYHVGSDSSGVAESMIESFPSGTLPAFNLTKDIKLKFGAGTKENPLVLY